MTETHRSLSGMTETHLVPNRNFQYAPNQSGIFWVKGDTCAIFETSFGAPTLGCRDVVEYEELMPDQLCVAWHLCGEGAGNIAGDHGGPSR